MLNKNKKGMVKLFLIALILLLVINLVNAEDLKQKPLRRGFETSDTRRGTETSSNVGGLQLNCPTGDNAYVCCAYIWKTLQPYALGDHLTYSDCFKSHIDPVYATTNAYAIIEGQIPVAGTTTSNPKCIVPPLCSEEKSIKSWGKNFCLNDKGIVCELVGVGVQPTGVKQCSVWQPSGQNCDKCDDDNDCTKYECMSLGKDCYFENGRCAKKDCLNENVCGGTGDFDGDNICDKSDEDMDGDAVNNDKDVYPCDPTRSEKEVVQDKEGPEIRPSIININQDATQFNLIIEARDIVSGIKNCKYLDEDLTPGDTNNGWTTFSKNNIDYVGSVHVTCYDTKGNSNTEVITITRKDDLKVTFPQYFNKNNNVVDNTQDQITITSNRLTKCGFKIDNENLVYLRDIDDEAWTTSHKVELWKFFGNKPDGEYNILIQCWENLNDIREKSYDVDVNFNAYKNINFDDYSIGSESIRGIKGSFSGGLGNTPKCSYKKLSATTFSNAQGEINALDLSSLTDSMSVTGDKTKWSIDSGRLSQTFLGSTYYYGVICQDPDNSWIKFKEVVEIKNYFPSFSIIVNGITNNAEGPFIEPSLTLSGRTSEAECRFKQTGSGVSDVEWDSMESLGTKVWSNEKIRLPVSGVLISGDVNLHFKCRGIPDTENEASKKIQVQVTYPPGYTGVVMEKFDCIEDCDKKEQTWGLYTLGAEASKDDKCYYICDNMDGYTDTFDNINSNDFIQFDSNGKDDYEFYHKHKFTESEGFLPNTKYDCSIYCKDRTNENNIRPGEELNMETPVIEIKDVVLNPDPKPVNNKDILSSSQLDINVKTSGGLNNQYKCRITNNIDEFSSADKDDLFYDTIDNIRKEVNSETWIYELGGNKLIYDRQFKQNLINHVITISNLKQNDDGSAKHYQLAIQCKDDANQYTRDSDGDIRIDGIALRDFDVDFTDLGIDLIKPLNEVQGKNVDVEIITIEGSTGQGKAKSCEINNIKLTRSRLDADSFKFSGRLENLEAGYNEFNINCIDDNNIPYSKIIDFNVVLNDFEIAGEQKTINENKAVLSFVGKYGVNGYGNGYCTYNLNKAGSGSISIDAFDISNEGGYDASDTTTYEKTLSLDKGVYSADVICYDTRAGTEIGRKDKAFVFEIKAEAGQISNKYISQDDIGKKCGDTVITENDIMKYCCSDGKIVEKEENCSAVQPTPTEFSITVNIESDNTKVPKINVITGGGKLKTGKATCMISDYDKESFINLNGGEIIIERDASLNPIKYQYSHIFSGLSDNIYSYIIRCRDDAQGGTSESRKAVTIKVNNGVGPSCPNDVMNNGEECDSNTGPCAGNIDAYTGGTWTCYNNCTFNTENCTPSLPQGDCGNNVINSGETCDGSNWGAITGCDKLDGFSGGTLACYAAKTANECHFDTSKCTSEQPTKCTEGQCDQNNNKWCHNQQWIIDNYCINCPADPDCVVPTSKCGNNIIDSDTNEQCDNINLNNKQCTDFDTYTSGALKCDSGCNYDYSSCKTSPPPDCGNSQINSGEACDTNNLNGETCITQGFGGGTLRCNANCQTFDTSSCTPPAFACNSLTSQTSCKNNNCYWSEGHGCDNKCYDGWTDTNNNKICIAPITVQCSISSINWVNKDGQAIAKANEGETVYILAEGSNCNIGDSLTYKIYEKDILVTDWAQPDDLIKKDTIRLQNKEGAVIEWKAVFDSNDGFSPNNNYYVKIEDMSSRLLETKKGCIEDWQCTSWDPTICPANGQQTRTCSDKNNCGTTNNKPALTQSCIYGAKTRLSDCNINCNNTNGCTCPANCVKPENSNVNNDENCGGNVGACISQLIDSQPTGCNGNNYCDGQGNCVSMYWKYKDSGPACRPSANVFKTCKPSNIGGDYTNYGNDIERDGVVPGDSLRAYDGSAPMGQIWCDEYECAIGNLVISTCSGSEPIGNGVLKGVSSYPQDYQTTSWTNRSDGRKLGACEWSCGSGYAQSGNGCVAVQPCVINSINWVNKDGQAIAKANEGEYVYGVIKGTNCNVNTNINYEIKEKDMFLGVDELAADDTIISISVSFTTVNVASITWQAIRQNDLADPNNQYYIKIGDRESSLLEVKEVVRDYRRTVLEECSDNCVDPDGCTCPKDCTVVGDINKWSTCGQATKDVTPPQILQIVTKSTNNYITTNERAKCYISTSKDPFVWTELNRDGEGKKHFVTLAVAYYVRCSDLSNNEGRVIGVSPMT